MLVRRQLQKGLVVRVSFISSHDPTRDPAHAAGETIRPLGLRAWSPRPELAPRTRGDLETGLVLESNGSPGCYGGWEIVYPPGAKGDCFKFRVKARWKDVKFGRDALSVEAKWEGPDGDWLDWAPVHNFTREGEWIVLEGILDNKTGAPALVIKLLMRWTPTGVIEWREPVLTPCDPPAPRRLRLGVAASPPAGTPKNLEENRDRFVAVAERAAGQGINLLCLPEVIFAAGLPRGTPERVVALAVEVPGPHIEPFQEVARRHRMAMCFSVHEKEAELIYNTAVLIDEDGDIIAKYRKVHLAPPGEMWRGITPGDEFPVARIKTADAAVGMNICMDSSAAEAARLTARAGAEILLLPIMGDLRSDGFVLKKPEFDMDRWQAIHRSRAMDNYVFLVAARNMVAGSGIFHPDGSILAISDGTQDILWADVDLSDLRRAWTGATFRDVLWYQRREELYRIHEARDR